MRVHRLQLVVLTSALLAACSTSQNNGLTPSADTGAADVNAAAVDFGDDAASPDAGPDVPGEPGRAVVDPTQITFGAVRQGESETVTIGISNTGGSDIFVSSVTLREFNRTGEPELVPGPNWDETFIVGAGLFREIDVTYAPKDFGADRGEIEILTTDPEADRVLVRLEALNAYADIEAPQFVRFGEVPPGESLTKRISVFNRGIDPLQLEDAVLGGISEAFAITFPLDALPTVLETGEDFVMDVEFAPSTSETARGTVTLTSDDPDEDIFEIALTGNDPTPCLSVGPDPVDLGEVAAGTSPSREVVLLNCSRTLTLDVNSVTLSDDAGGVFALSGLPTFPLEIAPLQTAKFTATGLMNEQGVSQGAISVESSDAKFDGEVELLIRVVEP